MRETINYICFAVGFVACGIGFWVLSSKFEADAYFRVTGKNVSTWDAMWIELRVQEPAK